MNTTAEGIVGFAVANAAALLLVGFVVAFVGWAGTLGMSKTGVRRIAVRGVAWTLGGTMVITGAYGGYVGMTAGPTGPGGGDIPDETPGVTWTWWVDGTEANSNHDANSEFPDSPFTACGSITPAGTVNTWDTDSFWNADTSTAVIDIAIDETLATTAAGYQADDCWSLDVYLQPGFVDNDGDGSMDDVPYYGRISRLTATTTTGANSSADIVNGFYHTNAAGWHIGYGEEVDAPAGSHAASDHRYISACSGGDPGYSTTSMAAECYGSWKQLGLYDDGDPDVVSIWSLFNNYGLWGYQNTVSHEVQADYDIGQPGSFFTVHVTWRIAS